MTVSVYSGRGNFDTAIGTAFYSRDIAALKKLGYLKLFIKFDPNRGYLCF